MAFVKEQWWYVAEDGRRIGFLWPEDFEAILESFYGDRKWVNKFSDDFGYHRSTVDRWRKGNTPIPKNVAQEVSMLNSLKLRGVALTPIDASWLPKLAADADPEPDDDALTE